MEDKLIIIIFIALFLLLILILSCCGVFNKNTDTYENYTIPENISLLQNINLTICAIVRDSEKTITKNLSDLDYIANFFKSKQFIIVENDSKDDTSGVLKRWGLGKGYVTIISEMMDSDIDPLLPELPVDSSGKKISYALSSRRFAKMAYVRNVYMQELRKSTSDWTIIVDLDISKIPLSETLSNLCSLVTTKEWDLVCANGITSNCTNFSEYCKFTRPDNGKRGRAYDSLATRFLGDDMKPYFVIDSEINNSNEEGTRDTWKKHEARAWTTITSPEQEPIGVSSCFGGLAVYKTDKIRDLVYEGEDCEHISVNKKLDNKWIYPGFVIYYD